MATISVTNPTLVICQFTDTRTYVRTLTKLLVFNPSEILLPNNLGALDRQDSGKLYQEISEEFPGANIVHIHRKYFKESRGLQAFRNLCSPEYSSVELQLSHKYYGLAAAFALLKYVEYIQNIIYAPKTLKVEFQASEESTLIDVETARHVELLVCSANPKSKNCLFGVINRCVTTGGIRYLRSSLFQPPTSSHVIEGRLQAVQELIEKPEILAGIQSVLGRNFDIDQLLALCATVPKAETIYAIESKINNFIGLKHVLDLVGPLHTVLLSAESDLLVKTRRVLEDQNFIEMLQKIQAVIHDEARIKKGSAAMKLQRCFAVKKGLNGLLDLARQSYCEIVEEIEVKARSLTEVYGFPCRVGYNASRGYHVQMTNGNGRKDNAPKLTLSDLPKEFISAQINRSLISFTTEEIAQADRKSQDQLRNICIMSNTILTELLQELRLTIGSLYRLSEAISILDVLASLTEVSNQPDFVKPTFGDQIEVKQGRHPILDQMNKNRVVQTVVPNDIIANVKDANFQLLSGSNMSGKSTYLKQVVLLQIMAQTGCYVPAEGSAQFRICDAIFSRVGTADNLEYNASTFMLEMRETSYILNNLGSKSMVIIDELGRGTSVDEGAAICWAICEELLKTTAFTFMATHFSLLPKLDKLYPNVKK